MPRVQAEPASCPTLTHTSLTHLLNSSDKCAADYVGGGGGSVVNYKSHPGYFDT